MNIKSQIFSGTPEQVQQQMSDFFKSRIVKIHGFAQSQSTTDTAIVVTTTLLYVEYDSGRQEITGFTR